jgi:RHS repeat-associated protein
MMGQGIAQGLVRELQFFHRLRARWTLALLLVSLSGAQVWAGSCEVYPLALSARTLEGLPVGADLPDLLNGGAPGNFGWLSWNGSPSTPTLIRSLTSPGDSETYVNPRDTADRQLSEGDWVSGKPGVSNSKQVRQALDALLGVEIIVPLWDQMQGQGDEAAYRVAGFARVQLLDYRLPGQNRISARFLGRVRCGAENVAPTVQAGPDQTITWPAEALLNGVVNDDGLPAGGMLTATWSQVSGPGTARFENAQSPDTAVSLDAPGTYVLRLTAGDGELFGSDDVLVTVNRPNQAPVAAPASVSTDEDQAVELVLAGSDPDGDAVTYSLETAPIYGSLSGLAPTLRYTPLADFNGTDSFTFKVSDGTLESAPAAVAIVIHAVNDPPVVDSQTLVSGEDESFGIRLSGADVEGSPLTFTLLSLPVHGTLAGAPPALTFLPGPDYHGPDQFTFAANDGELTSVTGLVSLRITNVNDAPLVSAGADQTVSLPSNRVVLAGSVFDDGFSPFLVIEWSQVSGTGKAVFAVSNAPVTEVTFSRSGVYVLRLAADDFSYTVSDEVILTVNAPPEVDAGADQTNTLPAEVILRGVVTDDGLPSDATNLVTWSKVSGPGTVLFASPSSPETRATFSESGLYTLRLTAEDSLVSAFDEAAVLVNRAPIVDAGSDQTNNALHTSLTGTVADDGLPQADSVRVVWTRVSGLGDVVFGSPTNLSTTVTFSRSGVHVLRLTASDALAESLDEVTVAANGIPVVDAGPDLRVTVGDEVQLAGAVTDDGLPAGVPLVTEWSFLDGTGVMEFEQPQQAVTFARFYEVGTYVLRLLADDSLTNAFDELTVTVRPVNQAPRVLAGPRQLVLQPGVAHLSGTVTDDALPDNAPVTVAWSSVRGPGTVTFSHPASPQTTAAFSVPGDYTLRLTAGDTELVSFAEVIVAVRTPAMNEAPVVSAGEDLVVGLTHEVRLQGTMTDDGLPPGAPVSGTWSVVSGPGMATFSQPSATNASPVTTASFPAVGTYVLRLTASDSELSGHDEVTVNVYPHNQPPLVDAGRDQEVILPDPELLYPGPFAVTNVNVLASRSLLSVDRWNNVIGQPGITGEPAGGFLWVSRNGLALDQGTLVVAGGFTNANGVWAKSLARFDGSNWFNFYDTNALPYVAGPGHDGTDPGSVVGWLVYDCGDFYFCNEIFDCAAVRGQEVFAAGLHKDLGNLDGLKDITARWEGSRWQSWDFKRVGDQVRVIQATADKVYVGGHLCFQPTNASSQTFTNLPWCYGLAVWDGTNWASFDRGVTDLEDNPLVPTAYAHSYVNSIAAAANGNVFAAGSFVMSTPHGLATNIVMWDGAQWSPLGGGLSGGKVGSFPVLSIAVADSGDLYAGGNFTNAGGFAVRNVARWDGSRWWPLGDGPANGVNNTVEALAVHGRDVYVGGSLTEAGGLSASRLAKWNGQFWSPLGSAASNGVYGNVYALAADETGVYVGGIFTKAGGLPANNLAKWEFAPPPALEVQLRGLVTDDGLPTGAPLTRQWTKASGPGEVKFADPDAGLTTASFSQAGTYVLRLTADDSDLTALDQVTVVVRANQPPVVDAGPDHVLGLEEPLMLKGSVSDDGLPGGAAVHHVWQHIYGPGTVTFDNPAEANVTARFDRQGTYVLRLSANDSQFTTLDEVTVIVMPKNQPPSVSAGSSATIVLGSSHPLRAIVTDDGSPTNGRLSVAWSVASGPGPVGFDDATLVQPTVSFSAPGTYLFRIAASDSELTSTAQVTVRVNLPNNSAPLVNAGPDQTLSNLFTRLQATVTDDGHPPTSGLTLAWTQVGGTGTATFADPTSPTTAVVFSQTGLYQLRLTVTDGAYSTDDTVAISIPNTQPPFVDAGPDRAITLPTNTVQLAGVALDTSPVTYSWFRESGPAAVTFTPSATIPNPTAVFSTPGTYVLRFTARDNAVNYPDTMRVVVASAGGNTAPAVSAGADQTLFLPTNTVSVQGAVTDDGLPSGGRVTTTWTQVAGPAVAAISDPSVPNPQLTLPAVGTYVLRLTASDTALTNGDDVTITVKPHLNTAPVVEVGPDLVTRVTHTVTLAGRVTDDALPSGGILSASWRKLSGPGVVTLGSASATAMASSRLDCVSTASFSLPGAYVLRLQADDSEFAAWADLAVTVLNLDDNLPPLVETGPDAHTVAYSPFILSGMVSDDGLPAGVGVGTLWSVVSGPARVYFSNPTELAPYAQFSAAGIYVLRLAATDSRLTSFDDVIITVSAPTNQPPFVFAGLPLEVTRPDPALLQGVVLDDGLPVGYPLASTWSQVDGPGTVTFVPDASDPLALAYFSAPGDYVLRLLADDSEWSVMDELTVTVRPGTNAPPSVQAGPDFTVALAEPAILSTAVSDDGLEQGLLQVAWRQLSGPGVVSFSTLNGVYRATFSAEGGYTLRLVAHDGSLTNSDDVAVTVVAAGPPVAQITAPADASIITAPAAILGTASSAVLDSYLIEYRMAGDDSLAPVGGEGQDAENRWTVLAAGSTAVVSNTLAVFDPTLLLNGLYELRLTVTDTLGRSAITEPVTLIVDRNLKVGHFTLSFEDLAIPSAGLPLQVTRTYDSRAAAAGIRGDFGIGWTLDIRNVRLQKNRPLGRNWEATSSGGLAPTYALDPVRPRLVTLTFPGGRQEKFAFEPDPMVQALVPIRYPQWRFTPIGNTRGHLVPAGYDEPDGGFLIAEGGFPGTVHLYDLNAFSGNAMASQEELDRYPTLFRYTSPDGRQYLIDEIDGLQSVTDANGNMLVVRPDGLTWTNTVAGTGSLTIAFQRDPTGRIIRIVDAAGHGLAYGYGTNGNLIAFTDRVGNTNGYAYDQPAFPHHLTGITDARGVTPIRCEYDPSGRLVANRDAFGHAIKYGHDVARRRESVTNRLGQVTILDYDDHGNVTREIDPQGGETLSTYDESGNVLQTVDPLGRTNSSTYDALDNRLSATDGLGNSTRFTYGPGRRVTSVTDSRGHTVTNTFDARGNLVSVRDPLGHVTRLACNEQGLPVAITNALGHVTRFEYDGLGRLARELDALGHATHYVHDSHGRLLTQTTTRTTATGLETLTSEFQYDAQGRLTRSVCPDGSTFGTLYNALGRPAVAVDPLGRQTVLDYDELGRLTRTTYPDGSSDSRGYDAEGRLTTSTNALGQVTRFDYDANGRLWRTVMADGATVTSHFDLAGQLLASTDARGNTTWHTYDAAGRTVAVTNALGEVTRSIYDAAGNLTASVDPLGRSTRFSYDALNRRVQTVFADGTTQTTWLDPLGRRTHQQDQAGKLTAYSYDNLGRLTAVTNALGEVTRYAYDELGRQISQTDANGSTTSFDCDAMGRRTRRTLPGGQVESSSYNPAGLLIQHTDFSGYTTSLEYDAMDRLLAKVPDPRRGEPTVTYACNPLGLRTNMIDATGTTRYRYDVRNRLVEKVRTWVAVGLSVALNYAYDANGNLTQVASSDPNGAAVAYEYDALNRLGAVHDARLGRAAYQYDPVGNLEHWTSPNGLSQLHQYDSLNRLTNLFSRRSSGSVASYTYALGPAGHRLEAGEQLVASLLVPPPPSGSRRYTYDDLYRLTGEEFRLGVQASTLTYGYDRAGNRLSRGGVNPPLPPQILRYDANDRLTTDTYDANGNTLFGAGLAQTQADRYDFENRLVSRRTALGTVEMGYDGDGNHVLKTVSTATNTVTTFYVLDDLNPTGYPQVLEEHCSHPPTPPTLQAVFAYGHTRLTQDRLSDDGSGAPAWTASVYGYDGHHNVRYLTDLAGNVTDTYDYDAFGSLLGQSCLSDRPTPNPYRFTGEEYDADLGLYYLRARYHNPDTGRFWTPDTFEGFGSDPASLHKYTYCGNDPVNCVDPTGNTTLAEVAHVSLIGGFTTAIVGSISRGVGAASGGANVWGSLDAANQGIGEDFAEGAVGGLFGYGAGKGAVWAMGRASPYLLRWSPEVLLSGFNRAAGQLRQGWLAAETAWARLETALIEGSETSVQTARLALTETQTSIAHLTTRYNTLAGRLGFRGATEIGLATTADEAVFWSGIGKGGAERAAKWAAQHGGATLETTFARRRIKLPTWDASNPASVAAWRWASTEFAAGAKGNVRVLQGDAARLGAVWVDEFSALKANPAVKSIRAINPETGAEVLLWSR